MVELGYKLSSEEFRPNDLVRYARMAEDAGFGLAMISDHFHPWTDAEGQAPFVWCTLGGVAQATRRIRVGTAVTCPILRVHPAIVAQAAATAADMFEGRFIFGIGSGEHLNEHVVGQRWPEPSVRLAMLEEAITILRALWSGETVSHHGAYFTVEAARLYTRPDVPPPLVIAADHEKSAALAGRLGDGLISTAPSEEVVKIFSGAGGLGKPRFVEITALYADDEAKAREMARQIWPIAGIPGPLMQELPMPRHFEALTPLVTADAIADHVTCGPDPEKYFEAVQRAVAAGFDHVIVHQIGPDQAGFIRFYEREVLPALRALPAAA
jgi:G6PDH family F420-dependent oxidoreductase